MTALAHTLPPEPPAPERRQRVLSATRGGVRTARASLFLYTALVELRQRCPLPGPEVPTDLPRRMHDMQWIAETMCSLHGVTVRTSGAIPRGPCLLVANHVGYLDPLAIASVVPCVAIAKHEVSTWPLLGEALVRLGNLFVRRGDAHSGAAVLLRARTCLSRGVPVLTFPEGTTTDGDDVLPLRRGIFGLARLTGLPVVPVAVRARPRQTAWVGDQAFLPHYLRTAARRATQVDLSFGPVLPPHAAASAQDLAAMAREQLRARLHDLEDDEA